MTTVMCYKFTPELGGRSTAAAAVAKEPSTQRSVLLTSTQLDR